jgi:hypothetical protein
VDNGCWREIVEMNCQEQECKIRAAVLKEEVAALKAGFKKFQAKKKLLQQFEKLWVKKLNKMNKPKKLDKILRKQSEITSVTSGFDIGPIED